MRDFEHQEIIKTVDDSNGARKFSPDTCQCVIVMDDNENHLHTFNKCKLHTALNLQALVNAIISHNQSFNTVSLNEEEKRANRKAERERILAM